jgi:hypothetical protein
VHQCTFKYILIDMGRHFHDIGRAFPLRIVFVRQLPRTAWMGSCEWARLFSTCFSVLGGHHHQHIINTYQPFGILIIRVNTTIMGSGVTSQQLLAMLPSTPQETPVSITPFGASDREYCLGCQIFVACTAQCRHCKGPYCSKFRMSCISNPN